MTVLLLNFYCIVLHTITIQLVDPHAMQVYGSGHSTVSLSDQKQSGKGQGSHSTDTMKIQDFFSTMETRKTSHALS